MLDPRVPRLAHVLVEHSLGVKPGEKIFIESFDMPSEVVACIVERVAAWASAAICNTSTAPPSQSPALNFSDADLPLW